MPKISVITPVYNGAGSIAQAIQNVLAQTWQDWELIVVDDGSTDGTPAVVARFTDPRIRYLYQVNQGPSAARNAGICVARGEYLAFLDADDGWSPAFLQHCLGILEGNDTLAGVYTRHCLMDQHGTMLPQVGGRVVPRNAFRVGLLEGTLFAIHAALVRSTVLHQAGLFDVELINAEDWDLWLRISEHCQMQGIEEPLAYYRVSPNSLSRDASRMHANCVIMLTRRFGSPEGDPLMWPEEKRRAYGFAYRSSAFDFIQQNQAEEGQSFLSQAVSIWPRLLERVDTFYELACGDQPRGYRGQANRLNIQANGLEMFKQLDVLFSQAGPELQSMRRTAYGNAYVALGMLSDQAGQWPEARRYLFQAIKTCPSLMLSYPVARRMLKLCVGKRPVHTIKHLQKLGEQENE